jgi:hypothetical protein
MDKSDDSEYHPPSREIAQAYTEAMLFAQQTEQNLRAILYAAKYHGWGSEIELDEKQLERHKSLEGFIDEAALGSLIKAVKTTGLIEMKPAAWKLFNNSCQFRNELAHRFLAEQNFDDMPEQKEKEIIRRLSEKNIELRFALTVSKRIRRKLEAMADEVHETMQREYVEAEYDNPDRHYATRETKKKR